MTNHHNKINFFDPGNGLKSLPTKQLKQKYTLFRFLKWPWLVDKGKSLITKSLSFNIPFVKSLVKKTIFDQFCGGESIEECEPKIKKLYNYNIQTILDYAAEGEEDEEVFDNNTEEILRTIKRAAKTPDIPFCVFKVSGLGSNKILEKVQDQNRSVTFNEHEAYGRIKERVSFLCHQAWEHRVKIFIDAEESWIQDVIDELAQEQMAFYNQDEAIVYNTYQMYRKDKLNALEKDITRARNNQYYIGVKLVRGAYVEKERLKAQKEGYSSPVHDTKNATDHDFNQGIMVCLRNLDVTGLCAATHNEYSNAMLMEQMQTFNLDKNDPRIYFSQLYGMSDNITYNLAEKGYNVAKYMPYGLLNTVIPYLFRRLDENTAIVRQTKNEMLMIKRELEKRKA